MRAFFCARMPPNYRSDSLAHLADAMVLSCRTPREAGLRRLRGSTELSGSGEFCTTCGVVKSAAEIAATDLPGVTAMSCFLIGAEELASRFGPEHLRSTIGRFQACITDIVAGSGGSVAQSMGRSALALFGHPDALADHAQKAVSAGRAVIDALGKFQVAGLPQVRIGIATAPEETGDLGGEHGAQRRVLC